MKLDIDKELKKLNIKEIKAPEYFEDLARITLKNIDELEDKRSRVKNKLKKKRYLQVALLFLSFTIIFGFKDVIAAVYNNLIGYDNYFSYSSYLEELNEENKIQMINEKITFSNGQEIVIDGLFYDGKYLTLFSKEIKKENVELTSKNNLIGIYVENKIPNLVSLDEDKSGNISYIYTYNTMDYLENINLNIKLKGLEEEKYLEIKIDKAKVVEGRVIEVNQEITSNDVKVTMKEIRVGANNITPTYSITSENKDLVNKIKNNNNKIFEEGISVSFWIDVKGVESMSSLAPDKIKELENGIEITQELAANDLRLDKMRKLKINLIGIHFSEKVKLNDFQEKEFYNEDLYIYEIDKDRNVIKYFSRLKGDKKKDKLRKYEIGPPNGYVLGIAGEDIDKKDILGENYKEFEYVMPMIRDLNEDKIILSENKLAGVELEDRTFKIDLKN